MALRFGSASLVSRGLTVDMVVNHRGSLLVTAHASVTAAACCGIVDDQPMSALSRQLLQSG